MGLGRGGEGQRGDGDGRLVEVAGSRGGDCVLGKKT